MKSVAMSRQWTEVFAGPRWKAEMFSGELELEGIPAFIPDSTMKMVDPFDVGGNVFDFRLLVPAGDAARAREIVDTPRAEQYDERPAESLSEPRVDAAMAELEAKGRRIRWSAVTMPFGLYGLWMSASYVPTTSKLATPPAGHRWTLFAIAICSIESALFLVVCAFVVARIFPLEALFSFL